ncbi:MAG: right-handed parallel beta-helix repeat-containing protein [Candidatus Sumerlaeota bacterium]|nr:right-handed parallel beta-helix repeat-containing protein [Candidatus Sumerlaeota bacterium]
MNNLYLKIIGFLIFLLFYVPLFCFSAVIRVGPSHDFQSIQPAIDAAAHGDEIIVSPGHYIEHIKFNGKNIILRSEDPESSPTVNATIIDGNNILCYSVVTFRGDEVTTCILSGFEITGGTSDEGAGIYGNGTHATIQYNFITKNGFRSLLWMANCGGGIYHCDGLIRNNVITYNDIGSDEVTCGGGLAYCDGIILNNVISHNSCASSAYSGGGGLYECNGIILNNVISHNYCGSFGGGLFDCKGIIRNNIIAFNATGVGGICVGYNSIIENNTIFNNHPDIDITNCKVTIKNCIIGDFVNWTPSSSSPSYCCIKLWTGNISGVGNITTSPLFIDIDKEDFHLQINSPCIDAGDPAEQYNDACLPPGKKTSRNDMGAYGGPYNCNWHENAPQALAIKHFLLGKTSEPASSDVNHDGIVDVADIIYLIK